MIVALISIFVGGVLLYAGITGRSVTSLLLGDSNTSTQNRSITG